MVTALIEAPEKSDNYLYLEILGSKSRNGCLAVAKVTSFFKSLALFKLGLQNFCQISFVILEWWSKKVPDGAEQQRLQPKISRLVSLSRLGIFRSNLPTFLTLS